MYDTLTETGLIYVSLRVGNVIYVYLFTFYDVVFDALY